MQIDARYGTSGVLAVAAAAGDTRPVENLDELAKGTDVFILQNMGPIKDFDALSYQSKLLIQVTARFNPDSGPWWGWPQGCHATHATKLAHLTAVQAPNRRNTVLGERATETSQLTH